MITDIDRNEGNTWRMNYLQGQRAKDDDSDDNFLEKVMWVCLACLYAMRVEPSMSSLGYFNVDEWLDGWLGGTWSLRKG